MGKRENKVETYFDEQLFIEFGAITRKWVSPGHNGVTDQIAFIPTGRIKPNGNPEGLIYFVEVKTTDGVLEPHQLREINRLIKHGADAFAVYGHVGVDSFVAMVREDIAAQLKKAL